MSGRQYAAITVAVLLCVNNAAIGARIATGAAGPGRLRPEVHYRVTLRMDADLHEKPARIRVFLPRDGPRQTLSAETIRATRLAYRVGPEGENRRAVFRAEGVDGHVGASYEADVHVRPAVFELPEGAPVASRPPREVHRHLAPGERVQSDAPEIQKRVEALLPAAGRDVAGTIRALYDFVHREIETGDPGRSLDAVSALRGRRALCGGKARLLAALLRAAGVPSRKVGGLILSPGSKRTTHAWVEAWVNGVWVPFDPLNGHFAERPATYLVLYRGDHALFTHTRSIDFQYRFHIEKRRAPPGHGAGGRRSGLDASGLWEGFRRAHIPLDLLRVVLLLPFGALALVVLRNVVGLTTFGTFHPVLIAVAFRDTGFVWGAALYVALLAVGLALRTALDGLQLLHTPRLALLLTFVVAFMLAASWASVRLDLVEPARIGVFPIAILAMAVESLFARSEELGPRQALGVLAQTLAAIAVVYAVIESDFVQALVFACPETLIGVAAAHVGLGRWMGLRLVEYHRFRWLLVE